MILFYTFFIEEALSIFSSIAKISGMWTYVVSGGRILAGSDGEVTVIEVVTLVGEEASMAKVGIGSADGYGVTRGDDEFEGG